MKLYIENGNLMFDYAGVDTEAQLNTETFKYQHFLRDSGCEWERTDKPNVKRMYFELYSWSTPYGNATRLRSHLRSCLSSARCNDVEISPDIEKYIEAVDKRCAELLEVEKAKERALAEKDKWERLCKGGCGRCENKARCGDDYICRASGDLLEEKNVPVNSGRIHVLFNYEAFPSENCPYNINKKQGENNVGTERLSETCASAAKA